MTEPEMRENPQEAEAGLELMPGRIPCHWLLVTLFAFSTAAAFWQHGHAALTVGIISAAFVFGFAAHIPKIGRAHV